MPQSLGVQLPRSEATLRPASKPAQQHWRANDPGAIPLPNILAQLKTFTFTLNLSDFSTHEFKSTLVGWKPGFFIEVGGYI